MCAQPISYPHLGHKDKHHDEGSTNEKSCAEDSGETIDKPLQSVGGDDDHCQYNAGDVDGCCNVLGIVQALHFHFACGKGEDKGNDLQHHLVAIENA